MWFFLLLFGISSYNYINLYINKLFITSYNKYTKIYFVHVNSGSFTFLEPIHLQIIQPTFITVYSESSILFRSILDPNFTSRHFFKQIPFNFSSSSILAPCKLQTLFARFYSGPVSGSKIELSPYQWKFQFEIITVQCKEEEQEDFYFIFSFLFMNLANEFNMNEIKNEMKWKT